MLNAAINVAANLPGYFSFARYGTEFRQGRIPMLGARKITFSRPRYRDSSSPRLHRSRNSQRAIADQRRARMLRSR